MLTPTLISVTALTGTQVGQWMTVPQDGRLYIPTIVSILAGTVTSILIEGRVVPGDAPKTLTSGSQSDGFALTRFPQIRATVQGGTGASVTINVDSQLRVAPVQ